MSTDRREIMLPAVSRQVINFDVTALSLARSLQLRDLNEVKKTASSREESRLPVMSKERLAELKALLEMETNTGVEFEIPDELRKLAA